MWEDPWIPTTPARPALPIAPVMHPNMRVSDFINPVTKEWDVGLLENYVNPEDIPLIRSLATSSAHRRDTFCWNYTRNGQYTVKFGYWVAQNVLKNRGGEGSPRIEYYKASSLRLEVKGTFEDMSSYMAVVNWPCGSNEELSKRQYEV